MWIAFLLQDKYSSDFEKENLKRNLIKKFNFKEQDICFTSYDCNSGINYYFFVKQYDKNDDLRKIWQAYPYVFDSFNNHVKITETQFYNMIRQAKKYQHGSVGFGDLVLINKGCYKKLYGIVLRESRNGKYDVGLKFRFGTVVKSFSKEEVKVIDNIFKYIKVLH